MPQIWPMNWLLLFTLIITIFLTFMVLIYFNNESEHLTNLEEKINSKPLQWMW